MRASQVLHAGPQIRIASTKVHFHKLPLVSLKNATVYTRHPTSKDCLKAPLFHCLSFSLDSERASAERWAVISKESSSVRTRFLKVLQGNYICLPPLARSWPYLESENYLSHHARGPGDPARCIRYVGFDNRAAGAGSTGTQGAYLGARYESRRESTDWSLLDYLRGTISLNLSEEEIKKAEERQHDEAFSRVIEDFKLQDLLDLPVSNLSNGQTRRARIAKALVDRPEALLLDEPFAGLDPINHRVLSSLLATLADRSDPRIVLALHASDPIPDWITHVLHLDNSGEVLGIGEKIDVYAADKELMHLPAAQASKKKRVYNFADPQRQAALKVAKKAGFDHVSDMEKGTIHKGLSEETKQAMILDREPGFQFWDSFDGARSIDTTSARKLVEMSGVRVSYGDRCVLGDWQDDVKGGKRLGLHWNVLEGDRWGIFGPNGSGKTTVISLLTSDHPQTYSLPIKLFGRSRLPTLSQPGLSIFDIQSRIGHSSPEVHTYFPKHFSIRQVLENAWAEAFHSRPRLTHAIDEQVTAALRWFRKELDPAAAGMEDRVTKFLGDRQASQNILRKWANQKPGASSFGRDWYEEDQEWADKIKFSESSFSAQRVALFLRAIIKKPDIVVLDEAFSGMNSETRKKCMMFLAHGEEKCTQRAYGWTAGVAPKADTPLKALGLVKITGLERRQALICVSHRKEEVPFVVNKWMCLPEANKQTPARFGVIDRSKDWWSDVWGIS